MMVIGSYKSYTDDTGFTYGDVSNTVQIFSITPLSWSPVMKGVMNITGVGFGVNTSNLKVYLINKNSSEKNY
jgi:hypothetical protein